MSGKDPHPFTLSLSISVAEVMSLSDKTKPSSEMARAPLYNSGPDGNQLNARGRCTPYRLGLYTRRSSFGPLPFKYSVASGGKSKGRSPGQARRPRGTGTVHHQHKRNVLAHSLDSGFCRNDGKAWGWWTSPGGIPRHFGRAAPRPPFGERKHTCQMTS